MPAIKGDMYINTHCNYSQPTLIKLYNENIGGHLTPLHGQGTQERSRLFYSWYTDPSLQGKGEHCNSQDSHYRLCRGREPCHRLGQGKSGRQRGTATDQTDKRSTLDQEDTDVHESGCRIIPTQPHMGPGDFQVTCSIEL